MKSRSRSRCQSNIRGSIHALRATFTVGTAPLFLSAGRALGDRSAVPLGGGEAWTRLAGLGCDDRFLDVLRGGLRLASGERNSFAMGLEVLEGGRGGLQQSADLVMLRKARAAVLLRFRGKRIPTLAVAFVVRFLFHSLVVYAPRSRSAVEPAHGLVPAVERLAAED